MAHETKKSPGRPRSYTGALATEILGRLRSGETLASICRDDHIPCKSTILGWIGDDVSGFSALHAHAREMSTYAIAEQVVEIADDGTHDYVERHRRDGSAETTLDAEHVQRSKLRVDTRKWLMERYNPKVFGARTALEHSAPGGGPILGIAMIPAKDKE